MNFITLVLASISSISAQTECPGPLEVGSATLRAYFENVQFRCINFDSNTGCRYREYTVPTAKDLPGGCQMRKQRPVMDTFVRNYDCESADNHWKFANEMVNKHNLTCMFNKNI
ncbi:hypothetical protein CONCODRAFT_85651 [Conidiobolus coronatus NRRL 28638]|uniref:Secreted protein n=1 Tax=Conidiobolus coronatus (strain ATCC 28846 / CBS 209.66 / NRRL 28638) TaxID=796925 RepID=A0A137P4A5_CONC2|nr:hypothetical protein CONCODRAFT_85651 [Conidiobolus coronatus NRRL 28638]|eukprot:KXN69845.1 hypothetical protein CONCODRAFT_85651 [Conidiobolus coronatus NRRL 28638]